MVNGRIKSEHLKRMAYLYVRQSTFRQFNENTESTKRQYALKMKLIDMGWDESRIEVIDSDIGQSGTDSHARHGFQHLVSEVSLGNAGIIAGIEVSRLSRSSSDWNRLLQIAALSDTLIMDEDGIYNVNEFNDRLLLGLKGTLSEAELHYLKARMRGGLLNKAKRGELKRALPIGYIYNESDLISKDPDAQVQESILLFFNTFKRIGSAHSVVREYDKKGFLFPNRQFKGFQLGELSWQRLTLAKAVRTLRNPIYAGIYVYGEKQTQNAVDGRKQKPVPREQYHAWFPDSHPGYISETQFEENNHQLSLNISPKRNMKHSGAIREGSSLLQGIALCGKCGRKMTIQYSHSNRTHQPVYVCDFNRRHNGEDACHRIVGGNIDITIGELLLETINPLTIDAAISIQREMTERKEEIMRLYSQRMERTHYEMDLAKRRYLRVDPDNRLVAAELERDWNQKASEYEAAKTAYEQKCETEIRAADEQLKLALEELVSDFPKIWNSPQTSIKEKKRILRLVVEDVTINSDLFTIVLGVRFKGGATKILEIPKHNRNLKLVKLEQEAVSEIKILLPLGLKNREIAEILNEKGLKSGYGDEPFDHRIISNLINNYDLPKRREMALADSGGWLTSKEKMAELGIGRHKLRKMRESGELICKTYQINGETHYYKPEKS